MRGRVKFQKFGTEKREFENAKKVEILGEKNQKKNKKKTYFHVEIGKILLEKNRSRRHQNLEPITWSAQWNRLGRRRWQHCLHASTDASDNTPKATVVTLLPSTAPWPQIFLLRSPPLSEEPQRAAFTFLLLPLSLRGMMVFEHGSQELLSD